MIFLHRKGKTYVCFLLEEAERGKKHGFIEMPVTELIFIQPSIMLTNYLPFVLTSFAISPRKTFNRPKKEQKKL